jgi:hypothetical protein
MTSFARTKMRAETPRRVTDDNKAEYAMGISIAFDFFSPRFNILSNGEGEFHYRYGYLVLLGRVCAGLRFSAACGKPRLIAINAEGDFAFLAVRGDEGSVPAERGSRFVKDTYWLLRNYSRGNCGEGASTSMAQLLLNFTFSRPASRQRRSGAAAEWRK